MTIDKIVLHCSDSPHGRGDDAATIHRWHRARGFDGIGYHYVILEDGEIQHGRPDYWDGAHAKGFNQGSIGICLIGDHYFTGDQLSCLKALVAIIKDDYPNTRVYNHYDLDPNKTCPNMDLAKICEE